MLLRWAFEEIQREEGQSVYCRLSTRAIDQPRRTIDPDLAAAIVAGAYWLREPAAGAELAIAYCGAVAPEALAADQAVAEDIPGAGLLAITSPDRLHRNWLVARVGGESSVAERLLARLRPGAALVTVGDFHPATLSWLGSVAGNPIVPLGVDRFGQSGDIPDLYRAYGIDTDAILDAAARACLAAWGKPDKYRLALQLLPSSIYTGAGGFAMARPATDRREARLCGRRRGYYGSPM